MQILKILSYQDGHANNMKILYSAGKPQIQKSQNVRWVLQHY